MLPKKWKLNINSFLNASLHLSSISLPDGIQRRKSEIDELQMREYFSESDLLVSEIQTIYSDTSVSVHTRNQKYGKLKYGVLLQCHPSYIKRSKSHFIHPAESNLEIILGLNGCIWIGFSRINGCEISVNFYIFS